MIIITLLDVGVEVELDFLESVGIQVWREKLNFAWF